MSAVWLSALVNGIIVSGILTLVIALIFWLSGRFWSAATRYAIWLVALSISALLPLVYLPGPASRISRPKPLSQTRTLVSPRTDTSAIVVPPPAVTVEHIERSGNVSEGKASLQAPFPVQVPLNRWTLWIKDAWLLAALLMTARLFASSLSLGRIRNRSFSPPEWISERIQDWKRQCGCRRRVQFRLSGEISTPIVAGLIRPLVLMPARLISDLSEVELDQVALHETAHISRYDDYTLVFQRFLEATLVFHPFIHWIGGRLELEREIACDDVVIRATGKPRNYARCLTRVIELAGVRRRAPLTVPVTSNRSSLERRIEMLIDSNRKPDTRGSKGQLAGIAVLIALMTGVASWRPQFVLFASPAPVSTTMFEQPIAVPVALEPATVSVSRTEGAPIRKSPAAVPAQDSTRTINLMSNEEEMAIGRELANELEQTVPVLNDSVVTDYVQGVGQNILANSDAKIPFTIKVVDSSEVGAFALPGGFMYLNKGLILAAANEAELAAVMAHLIVHVTARHGAQQASKGTLLNIGRIPVVFLGGPAGSGLRQYAGVIPIPFLSFSRSNESEADYLGLQYLYKAGYDPAAIITFSGNLQASETANPGTINRLFSTHPPTSDRLEQIRQNVGMLQPTRGQFILTTPAFSEIRARLSRQAADMFSGTWNLNIARTAEANAGYPVALRAFKVPITEKFGADDNGIKGVSDAAGGAHMEYDVKFDGKDYPVTVLLDGKPNLNVPFTTYSAKKIDDYTIEFTVNLHGPGTKVTRAKEIMTISKDGKTRTVKQGDSVDQTFGFIVWDKQ